MLIVHHLNNSRSQRILWLLEELGVDYEIKHYARDPDTNRAPAELKAVHQLGKSPVIEDDGLIVAETGAIIVYLLDKYADHNLRPEKGTQEYVDYVHFLHFAEGSAMLPMLLSLYTSYLGDAAAPLQPMIMAEIKGILDYCEYHLISKKWFAGDHMTGADIQMIFPLEAMKARGRLKGYDACNEYVERIHAMPAYQRALEKGGEYAYGPK
ncbi:glutathione S-transferase [Litorimonas cladophorae]|uniref:glutathione transferase n=1 Tax=Litorimonas cladophorae TaxID=1220491 RepID=A0A918KCL1_9PROT|nr:glutathione S-transferase [Litorimonas cladophorae]GGX58627.1 glutathione S-transferase [Litorimonas cladophorae]